MLPHERLFALLAFLFILVASLLAPPTPEKSAEVDCAERCYPHEPDPRVFDGVLICYCGVRRVTPRSP